jgi:hypothetical protein
MRYVAFAHRPDAAALAALEAVVAVVTAVETRLEERAP